MGRVCTGGRDGEERSIKKFPSPAVVSKSEACKYCYRRST